MDNITPLDRFEKYIAGKWIPNFSHYGGNKYESSGLGFMGPGGPEEAEKSRERFFSQSIEDQVGSFNACAFYFDFSSESTTQDYLEFVLCVKDLIHDDPEVYFATDSGQVLPIQLTPGKEHDLFSYLKHQEEGMEKYMERYLGYMRRLIADGKSLDDSYQKYTEVILPPYHKVVDEFFTTEYPASRKVHLIFHKKTKLYTQLYPWLIKHRPSFNF